MTAEYSSDLGKTLNYFATDVSVGYCHLLNDASPCIPFSISEIKYPFKKGRRDMILFLFNIYNEVFTKFENYDNLY